MKVASFPPNFVHSQTTNTLIHHRQLFLFFRLLLILCADQSKANATTDENVYFMYIARVNFYFHLALAHNLNLCDNCSFQRSNKNTSNIRNLSNNDHSWMCDLCKKHVKFPISKITGIDDWIWRPAEVAYSLSQLFTTPFHPGASEHQARIA